tara:strand:- start:146 stop:901 length:756 start_codon:yes stop_codon:yes gene_type:complete
MNDIVTKLTKTKPKVKIGNMEIPDMPNIDMPKLSVPENPIVNFNKKPSPVSPGGLKNSIFSLFGEGWLWNVFVIFMIIIILAILGINLFMYLARGSDYLADIAEGIGSYIPLSLGNTFHMSAVGTKATADIAADTLDDVGDIVGEEVSINTKKREFRRKRQKRLDRSGEYERISKLKDAIDKRDGNAITRLNELEASNQEDDGSKKGKSGWCYIGTDRGYRSCMKVNESDKCMSGEIFPTKDVCVNPNLRV